MLSKNYRARGKFACKIFALNSVIVYRILRNYLLPSLKQDFLFPEV